MSSFFSNPTTFNFCLAKVTSRWHCICLNIVFWLLLLKIASESEGRRPSLNHEQFVAESKLALLGILSRQSNKYISI